MSFRLRLFGPFSVHDPHGRQVVLSSRKAQALVAMLALAGGRPVPRARIVATLWGDRAEDSARSNLRQALSVLRRSFAPHGEAPFRITESEAALLPGRIATDLDLPGPDGTIPEGEFLEGIALAEPAAQDWLEAERRRLGALRLAGARALAEAAAAREDWAAAAGAAEAALRLDPCDEAVHRLAMLAAFRRGDRVGALRRFELCRARLAADLGVLPDEATMALKAEIAAAGAAAAAGPGPDRTVTDRPVSDRPVSDRPVSDRPGTDRLGAYGAGPPGATAVAAPAAADRTSGASAVAGQAPGAASPLAPPVRPGSRAAGAVAEAVTRLAILPFRSLGSEADDVFLAEGIAEDLITGLARQRHLSVVGQPSAAAWKGRALDLTALRRDLDADLILRGSLRRSGERLRVTVHLVDAGTGAELWGERFEAAFADIFAVQDEIVAGILARLAFDLDEVAATQRGARHAATGDAYGHFLRARALWRDGRPTAARRELAAALAVDPDYPRALAFLGYTASAGIFMQEFEPDAAALIAEAREMTARALAAGQSDHYVLQRAAMTLGLIGEADAARPFSERALRQAPNDIEAMLVHGLVLAYCGEAAAGVALMKRPFALEPRLPPTFHAGLADGLFLAGEAGEAATVLARIPDPQAYVIGCRAAFAAAAGDLVTARRLVAAIPAGFDLAALGRTNASLCLGPGDRERMLAAFRAAGATV